MNLLDIRLVAALALAVPVLPSFAANWIAVATHRDTRVSSFRKAFSNPVVGQVEDMIRSGWRERKK